MLDKAPSLIERLGFLYPPCFIKTFAFYLYPMDLMPMLFSPRGLFIFDIFYFSKATFLYGILQQVNLPTYLLDCE
jgi:hypothetical protein